ncbi:alpha-ketoglutarate-dependent dioxygenase AlkB [Pseudoroseomonas deserti]|uniref:Alpha-ketoglutarate-dependent dioxygenase AlkB n=1 Tax=Teichococcus deserti TaxID=1817963 RepID=A0A1V2H1X5_9PROT|nr:DNA oxidative demethylase AlkB [Pseudoroseomonas deserti]ONG50880.1 alpha-ketoglutarate-dependent dioxygenase AlkB [Pseudoroseomonas deserti]
MAQPDLFAPPSPARDILSPGALLLRGFALDAAPDLLAGIAAIEAQAPFRHMVTPGGFTMSVAMTSCGALGWVTDRRGYRYAPHDPDTGAPWPAMPEAFRALAERAAAEAGFPGFAPDTCLINRYIPGAKLALHQDKDERDTGAPIVSVSLGLPATFQWGGLQRGDTVRRLALEHGDVLAWGGPSRLFHHGILALKPGHHPATGATRLNLTFRRAG